MLNLTELGFALAPIALCVTQERVIEVCNPAFSALFGYDTAELPNASIAILYPSLAEFHRIGNRGYPQMERTGHYSDERLMRRKDASMIWCRVKGMAVDPSIPSSTAVWSFEPMSHNTANTERLSPREREVVTHLAQGLSSKEIARLLKLSPRTVEMHRARLLIKFNASTTAKLLALLV